MQVGGEETRLNVNPFSFQFELAAANPSSWDAADVASKMAPYQLRHASSCCDTGNEWVENVSAIKAFSGSTLK